MKAALLASAALGSLLVAATPARRAIPNTRIGVPVAALDPDTSDSSYAAVYKLQIVQYAQPASPLPPSLSSRHDVMGERPRTGYESNSYLQKV